MARLVCRLTHPKLWQCYVVGWQRSSWQRGCAALRDEICRARTPGGQSASCSAAMAAPAPVATRDSEEVSFVMDPLPGVCTGRSHFGSFLESPFEPHVMMTFVCAFVLQTLDDVGPKLDCFVFSFAQPLEFVVRTFLHPTPSAKPIPHDQ